MTDVPEVCMKGKLPDERLEKLAQESAVSSQLSQESFDLARSLSRNDNQAVVFRANQLSACMASNLPPHYLNPRTPAKSMTVTTPTGRQKTIPNR